MDRIAAAFARALGEAVVTGAEVLALRRVEGGAQRDLARRRWRGARRKWAAVLVALPAPVLASARHRFLRRAAGRHSAALQLFRRRPSSAFLAKRRFWEEDAAIYGGISWTGRDATQVWYPSHGFHGEQGRAGRRLYLGRRCRSALRRRCSPEARAAAWRRTARRCIPGYAREVSAPVSVAWARMPRARGAWAEWTTAQRAHEYPLLRAPEGPYHFAGEYLSWLTGWQEGAVLSAWNALEGLADLQK